jgi:protein-L-isoaspartate(D-aspartate) O-methyltransferase
MQADPTRGWTIRDPRIRAAMRRVPRERFVPRECLDAAYDDHPLPIGLGQTISQPSLVAYMTELAAVQPGGRVLEIGTGSGYQAAVLAELGADVFTIEIIPALASRADALLRELGYRSIHLRQGDGHGGWPEAAPFDAIIVTAAPEAIPPPLVGQLRDGGRLVIPLGAPAGEQELQLVTRRGGRLEVTGTLPVRFVPFTRAPQAHMRKSPPST